MSTATATRRVLADARLLLGRLKLAGADNPVLTRLRLDPAAILTMAGMTPDGWQTDLIRSSDDRILMLAARQTGKSTTASALAMLTALLRPGSLTLLLSPSLRQSGELFRDKFLRLFDLIGRPVPEVRRTALELSLANGSRVVSLPAEERTVRGFSGVGMLIVDEASRVLDPLMAAVRPMLATSGGRLVALSTPFGRRGWYFEAWESSERWRRVKVKASECARIPKDFLEAERRALGDRYFRQEFECSFEEAVDQVFDNEDIEAAVSHDVQPLFPEECDV